MASKKTKYKQKKQREAIVEQKIRESEFERVYTNTMQRMMTVKSK